MGYFDYDETEYDERFEEEEEQKRRVPSPGLLRGFEEVKRYQRYGFASGQSAGVVR